MFNTYDACTPSGGGTQVGGTKDDAGDRKNEKHDGSKPFYVHVLCAGNNELKNDAGCPELSIRYYLTN